MKSWYITESLADETLKKHTIIQHPQNQEILSWLEFQNI